MAERPKIALLADMHCPFCQISANTRPARVFLENDTVIVFEDIIPRAAIHLLVCPKAHVERLAEVSDELLGQLLATVREVTRRLDIEDNFRLVLNNGASAGQIIDHLHFHIMSNARRNLELEGRSGR
ncbi:MAG: HIT domain-containing protein [candidate division Zixibacteria bacterium]|nr:HIT domain-containing protein [candidate division Zixibacteria bacterium]